LNQNQKPLTLQQAAGIAGVSPDTIARWCRRYRIGKQLHSKAPWRVDPSGLAIVAAGDGEALAAYMARDVGSMLDPDSLNRHDLQGE
jgi:hypothetical protein